MNPFGAILKLSKLLDLRFFPKIYDFLSEVSVSVSEIVSDPRPRVTRPAGAGHTTCGRGSRDLRARVADQMLMRNGNKGFGICPPVS